MSQSVWGGANPHGLGGYPNIQGCSGINPTVGGGTPFLRHPQDLGGGGNLQIQVHSQPPPHYLGVSLTCRAVLGCPPKKKKGVPDFGVP